MSFDRFKWFNGLFTTDLDAHTKLVGAYLFRRAGKNGESFPSVVEISDRCKINVKTVRRALKILLWVGLISEQKRPGRSTVYILARTETEGVPLPPGTEWQTFSHQGPETVPLPDESGGPGIETVLAPTVSDPQTEQLQNTKQTNHDDHDVAASPKTSRVSPAVKPKTELRKSWSETDLVELGLPPELSRFEVSRTPSLPDYEFVSLWQQFRGERFGQKTGSRMYRRAEVLCALCSPEQLREAFEAFAKAERSSLNYLVKCVMSVLESSTVGVDRHDTQFPWVETLLKISADLTSEYWGKLDEPTRESWYSFLKGIA